MNENDKQKWLEINEKYSKLWPNISEKKIRQKTLMNLGKLKIN